VSDVPTTLPDEEPDEPLDPDEFGDGGEEGDE
jgi:hypothetical protein